MFELHLLGGASLGRPAGTPQLARAKRPAPPCLYSCQKDYADGRQEGKMEERPGSGSGGQG